MAGMGPSPLPVLEAGLYLLLNHGVRGAPEGQIRLSKGVIAKFVQTLKLEVRKSHFGQMERPRWLFCFLSSGWRLDLYFQSSKLALINWHFLADL